MSAGPDLALDIANTLRAYIKHEVTIAKIDILTELGHGHEALAQSRCSNTAEATEAYRKLLEQLRALQSGDHY